MGRSGGTGIRVLWGRDSGRIREGIKTGVCQRVGKMEVNGHAPRSSFISTSTCFSLKNWMGRRATGSIFLGAAVLAGPFFFADFQRDLCGAFPAASTTTPVGPPSGIEDIADIVVDVGILFRIRKWSWE